MHAPSEPSCYLVSLFAALRELPPEVWERELEARCRDPELRNLALGIVTEQQNEIRLMRAWLARKQGEEAR